MSKRRKKPVQRKTIITNSRVNKKTIGAVRPARRRTAGSVQKHFAQARHLIELQMAQLMIKKMHTTKKRSKARYQKRINELRRTLRKIS
jgi:hypothetical protein